MADEDKQIEALMYEGIVPKTTEGFTAGSVYTIAVRTRKGYVGVRRLSEHTFRVRAQRFDKALLADKLPPALITRLKRAGLHPSEEGIRISGLAIGVDAVIHRIGLLSAVLQAAEFNLEDHAVQTDQGTESVLQYESHVLSCKDCSKFHQIEENPTMKPHAMKVTASEEQAEEPTQPSEAAKPQASEEPELVLPPKKDSGFN